MKGLWQATTNQDLSPEDYTEIEFWSNPKRITWLTNHVTRSSMLRSVILVSTCLTMKGAEDMVHKPCAFELSTTNHDTMYFIVNLEKEKEKWINSIGRSIVQHSRSLTDSEVVDYDSSRQ
ncbi:unnamed protein product [Malus baccata var. baccata]